MKKLLALMSFAVMAPSFASTLSFEGYIRNPDFPIFEGRKCRIDLVKVKTRVGEKVAYIARPRIRDLSYFFNKTRAPLPEMRISDEMAENDNNTIGNPNMLAGIGSKYRNEMSQRLYVDFDKNKQITSWSYLDGTNTASALTYTCSK